MTVILDKETIQKFDKVAPRYTSYPTAPQCTKEVTDEDYKERLRSFALTDKSLSLYIHIPFCESLCTYCGCNVVIRKNNDYYGDQYVDYLGKEMEIITKYMGRRNISHLHLGGGTPTYLNVQQLKELFKGIQSFFEFDDNAELAIEIDPRTVDWDKLETLRSLGFNRISMGVQDFDNDVQKSINRIQSIDEVTTLVENCRQLNFRSINFDLIYGLPNQTKESFSKTVNEVIRLRPDRIALYSFAYIPWLKKHQKKIDTKTMPNINEKLDIFLQSRTQFIDFGYEAIAMDHFALKGDELTQAFRDNKLYRNFMGYTTKSADEFIGLGLTSIGFIKDLFIQNQKHINNYYRDLDEGKLPVERGLTLSEDDKIRQWVINNLMCYFEIDKNIFQDVFKIDFDQYFLQEKNILMNVVRMSYYIRKRI